MRQSRNCTQKKYRVMLVILLMAVRNLLIIDQEHWWNGLELVQSKISVEAVGECIVGVLERIEFVVAKY